MSYFPGQLADKFLISFLFSLQIADIFFLDGKAWFIFSLEFVWCLLQIINGLYLTCKAMYTDVQGIAAQH